MEPPVGPEASYLQDEKAKVFAAMRPIDPQGARARPVRRLPRRAGRRRRTRTTETFVAARLEIDSWRWAGVPWYVRGGKALGRGATEVVVEFREPPRMLFDEAGGPPPERNLVRFRLGSNDGVTFTLQAKTPGRAPRQPDVDLAVDFAAALGERQEAYERLLDDALAGSPRRFAREDIVEHEWRIVQPALDYARPGAPVLPRHLGPHRGRRLPRRRPAW